MFGSSLLKTFLATIFPDHTPLDFEIIFALIFFDPKERDWVVISPIERSSLIARSKILSKSGNSILIRATFYFGKSSIL